MNRVLLDLEIIFMEHEWGGRVTFSRHVRPRSDVPLNYIFHHSPESPRLTFEKNVWQFDRIQFLSETIQQMFVDLSKLLQSVGRRPTSLLSYICFISVYC